jgi:23S rRNA maturation mini-RNase III
MESLQENAQSKFLWKVFITLLRRSSTGRCMRGANANDRKKARCAIDLYSLRPATTLIAIGFGQNSEQQRNPIRQV